MDLANGNGTLSVGVKILDCDHREMFEAISELHATAVAGKDRNRTGLLLRNLAHFTLTHFALEEGLMAATKYPGLAQHRLNHKCLMEHLEALISLHDRDGLTLNPDSLGFLQEWLTAHIQNDDMHYGLWVNQVDKRYTSKESWVDANNRGAGFGSEASS